MMHKKKSGVANRAWNLLRLALLWARKGGPFKHGLMLDLRLFPKFLKTGLIGQSSTQRAAVYYGERELSLDDTPIIPVKMHRPSSLRFRLPRIPCIIPPVDFDYNFNFDDNKDFLSRYKFEYDEGRKSFSNGGDDDDENCEVCEDEGIDAKAEQFIAKFYEQMRMQRQVSYLQYNENSRTRLVLIFEREERDRLFHDRFVNRVFTERRNLSCPFTQSTAEIRFHL